MKNSFLDRYQQVIMVIATFLAGFLFLAIPVVSNANTKSIDLESGSSEYLYINDGSQTGLDITGDMTVESWIKFESLPSSGTSYAVGSKDVSQPERSFGLGVRNDSGTYKAFMYNSADGTNASTTGQQLVTLPSLSTGTWYHMAWSYASSTGSYEFYLNGESQGSQSNLNNSMYNSSALFAVGRMENHSHIDGLVDEFRVWNVARSSTEIQNNYDIELDGSEENLVSYWQFENNLNDETANNNDLTSSGSATYSSDIPSLSIPSGEVLEVRKSSDQSITSNNVLQNDSQLVLTVATSSNYIIDGAIFAVSTSGTPDIKIGFDVPPGVTMDLSFLSGSEGNFREAALLETDGAASAVIPITANKVTVIQVKGTISTTSSGGGNVRLLWSQGTSNGTATTVKTGSYLRADEI